MDEGLRPAGPVHHRRLQRLLGNALEAGVEHEDDEGRVLPHVGEDDRPERPDGIARPPRPSHADQREEVVHEPPVTLEHPPHEEPGDRGRDGHGQEHHGADEAPARDAGVEEKGDGGAEDELDGDGGDGEPRGNLEGVPERVVAEDVCEVVEPDEGLPGDREVVVVEAEAHAVDERVEEDDRQDGQARDEEDQAVAALLPAHAGPPAAGESRPPPGATDGVRASERQ